MRLTEHMIIARSKESDLSTIRRINLWGCDLTDISIVKKMTNLEILALSVNNLSSLQPLEACTKLQELYLRKNNIQDFRQLLHLRKLPSLTNLWLAENPCCARAGSNYRACVLSMLPNLKKLDDEIVTPDDIDKANKLNCADYETSEFGTTLAKDSPKAEPAFEQLSTSFCLSSQGDAEQHAIASMNKQNTCELSITQESMQMQSPIYKEEAYKYDEIQPAILEQASLESTQQTNLYLSETQNQMSQRLHPRYAPPDVPPRSDGGATMPLESQPMGEPNRPQSHNHPAAHNLSMNSTQQIQQSDLTDFESTRSLQIEQALQYQGAQSQGNSPQTYQMQISMQQQQHQQQQRSPMQHQSPAYAATQHTQNWSQQEAMMHMQPALNQRSPLPAKNIRWPAVSHLDISQATELDLSLKIPRSFSMQTINEHAEWEETRRSENCRSIQNPQRYTNAETAQAYCRENINVAINGSVSAREPETENWDDGSVTSRTRIMAANPPNRELNRHEVPRSSRSRSSQPFQRETIVEDCTQSARSRFSQSTNQDFDGDDDLRSYRTGTTLSSRNLRRRNMHVLSALLCIIPELDLESLQVLEHNIVCRMDELSSS